jgi:DNA-binding IclR family transcriptional regulator
MELNVVHSTEHPVPLVPAVERAIRVLHALGGEGDNLGLSDLSRLLGISKSTLSGILSTLEHFELVRRDPQSLTFRLGVGLLDLSHALLSRLDLRQLAHSHLVELCAVSGETALLHAPGGGQPLIVDRAEPDRQLKVVAPVGLRMPAVAGSVAKAFLAELPQAESEALIRSKPLPAFTPHSITDPDRFLQELANVRRAGYATDDEEYLRGVRAASAVIRDRAGRAVGAISIAGVVDRVPIEQLQQLAARVRAAADAVSAGLRTMGGAA